MWEREFYYNGWNSTKTDEDPIKSSIRRATQMVYAEASKIGCGVTNCGRIPSMQSMYMVNVVCYYEKAVSNTPSNIYIPGETCSACSEGFQCETSSGLCA